MSSSQRNLNIPVIITVIDQDGSSIPLVNRWWDTGNEEQKKFVQKITSIADLSLNTSGQGYTAEAFSQAVIALGEDSQSAAGLQRSDWAVLTGDEALDFRLKHYLSDWDTPRHVHPTADGTTASAQSTVAVSGVGQNSQVSNLQAKAEAALQADGTEADTKIAVDTSCGEKTED
jgi:hypothetical protein